MSLKHAKQRLLVAERAAAALGSSISFEEAEIAWSTFLTASHAIYSKLDAGVGVLGQERYWWGRVKHIRRKDELLRYIHHARNSEEHGIDESASRDSKVFTFKFRIEDGSFREYELVVPCPDDEFSIEPTMEIAPDQTNNAHVVAERRRLTLLTIYDRKYNDSFLVPRLHLGQSVVGFDAFKIANLTLKYLSDLTNRAASFVST